MSKSMFKYAIDSIIDSIRVIDNKLPVCNFFDNVLLGKPDNINVLVFTIEGEPQIRMITYNSKELSQNYRIAIFKDNLIYQEIALCSKKIPPYHFDMLLLRCSSF